MKSKKAFLGSVLVILTILVIDGNAGAATIYVPDDHGTIQLAINNATDGDTIIVRDGTYSEHIELGTSSASPDNTKNNLTIQAENQGFATIQYTEGSAVSVVEIAGDSGGVPTGTIIDGFNLDRSGSGGGRGAGVFVHNSNSSTYATVTVKNCAMSGNTKFRSGVRLDGYIVATITGNTITGPQEAGIATSISPGSPPNNDYLYGNSQITIEDNTINGNSVTQQAGIFLRGYSGNTVQVIIRGTGTGEVKTSHIHHNRTAGIRLEDIYDAVTIDNNEINNNSNAGIRIIDVGSETSAATIQNNDIHQNTKSGIAIFNACTVIITDNEIYDHTGAAGIFTGDWSGTLPPTGSGFDRTNGPVDLTIKRNKVYGNRAGMRLDHASGTITNNLVYGNFRAGIRFSGNNVSTYAPFSASWGITEIMNNTVDNNGSYVAEFSENRGGGIVYDDISDTATRNFFDPPVGATQNPITIKNNIVANNMKAGIKFCADNTGDNRSYNLLYRNFEGTCDTGWSVDCGRMCRSKTLGRCDAPAVNCCSEDSWADFAVVDFPGDWAIGEICGEDPLFNADYTLQGGSPALGAGSDNNDMGAYGGSDPITW